MGPTFERIFGKKSAMRLPGSRPPVTRLMSVIES